MIGDTMTSKANKISIADLSSRNRDAVQHLLDARLADEKPGGKSADARRLRRGTSATVQLNVRLPQTAKSDVYRLAEELDLTISEVIEQAIAILKASQSKR
jgi:hypothetical protein